MWDMSAVKLKMIVHFRVRMVIVAKFIIHLDKDTVEKKKEGFFSHL